MSNSSTSTTLSSSNIAKIDAVQPVVFGSFRVALSPDASGLASVAASWPTRTATSAADTARALVMVRVGVATLERDAVDRAFREAGEGPAAGRRRSASAMGRVTGGLEPTGG